MEYYRQGPQVQVSYGKETVTSKRTYFSKKNLMIYASVLAVMLALHAMNQKVFWTALLAFIGSVVKFLRTKVSIPLEIEPVFFFSVIIAHTYGYFYGFMLEAVSVLVVNIIKMDFMQNMVLGLVKPALVLMLLPLFGDMNLVVVGIILSVVRSVLGMSMGLLSGVPITAMLFVPLNPIVNVYYFTTLLSIMISLVKF